MNAMIRGVYVRKAHTGRKRKKRNKKGGRVDVLNARVGKGRGGRGGRRRERGEVFDILKSGLEKRSDNDRQPSLSPIHCFFIIAFFPLSLWGRVAADKEAQSVGV